MNIAPNAGYMLAVDKDVIRCFDLHRSAQCRITNPALPGEFHPVASPRNAAQTGPTSAQAAPCRPLPHRRSPSRLKRDAQHSFVAINAFISIRPTKPRTFEKGKDVVKP